MSLVDCSCCRSFWGQHPEITCPHEPEGPDAFQEMVRQRYPRVAAFYGYGEQVETTLWGRKDAG